jgi:hypothetical protein
MRAAVLLLLLFAAPASAQLRTIPKEAQYGEIRHLQSMVVELNGKPVQLSPGAQIRDADNRLVLPISLTEKVGVGYLVDGMGLVHRVWILSPEEQARVPQRPLQPDTK